MSITSFGFVHKSRIGKISKLITFRATFQSTSPLLNYSNCSRFVVLRPTFGTTRASDLNILTVLLFFSLVLIGSFGNKVWDKTKTGFNYLCPQHGCFSEILTVQLVRLITTTQCQFQSSIKLNKQVINLSRFTPFSFNFKMIN